MFRVCRNCCYFEGCGYRSPALQAGGDWFESSTAHQSFNPCRPAWDRGFFVAGAFWAGELSNLLLLEEKRGIFFGSDLMFSFGESHGKVTEGDVCQPHGCGAPRTKYRRFELHPTVFRNRPIPSISISSTSPALRNSGGFCPIPTPDGVPVMTMSPGSRTIPADNWLIRKGMS